MLTTVYASFYCCMNARVILITKYASTQKYNNDLRNHFACFTCCDQHSRLKSDVIMRSRVQTIPEAQDGQPSHNWELLSIEGTDWEEISAIVTKLAQRKVACIQTCHSSTTSTCYGLPFYVSTIAPIQSGATSGNTPLSDRAIVLNSSLLYFIWPQQQWDCVHL